MWFKLAFDEDTDEGRYFLACARIRKISPTALMKRLLAEIAKDHLVLSILDDANDKQERRPGENSFSELRTPG